MNWWDCMSLFEKKSFFSCLELTCSEYLRLFQWYNEGIYFMRRFFVIRSCKTHIHMCTQLLPINNVSEKTSKKKKLCREKWIFVGVLTGNYKKFKFCLESFWVIGSEILSLICLRATPLSKVPWNAFYDYQHWFLMFSFHSLDVLKVTAARVVITKILMDRILVRITNS